jgi:hypothetical protein
LPEGAFGCATSERTDAKLNAPNSSLRASLLALGVTLGGAALIWMIGRAIRYLMIGK